MTRASLVIFIGSLLASTVVSATTYVRVEKDGTKTYSDRPLPGGQAIDIQPAQTYSAPPSTTSSSVNRPPEEQALNEAANFRYQCAMAPRADETFQNPESVTLRVALTPNLRSGDEVQFSVDGNTVPNGENQTIVTLTMPDRGTHSASVRVFDRSGKAVCDASTTFHVQRTGLNSPANRRPPPRPSIPRPTPH